MCKADVLDYMNRSRKICEHNNDPETKKIAALITTLASKVSHTHTQCLFACFADLNQNPSPNHKPRTVCRGGSATAATNGAKDAGGGGGG